MASATTAAPAASGDTLLNAVMEANKKEGTEAAPTMTLRELEKKHPEKAEELKEKSPEKYAEMYKAQYGVEFKA